MQLLILIKIISLYLAQLKLAEPFFLMVRRQFTRTDENERNLYRVWSIKLIKIKKM